MIKWLWKYLPCFHVWKKVHTGPLGAYQTRHHLKCKKCSAVSNCNCIVCQEPWRDW